MDGQDRETAGKRTTKNSTSLVEEEKDLARAKKESEKQIRQEQKLKRKEDEDLKMALAVSKLQVGNDKPLAISVQKAEREELGDHLINVQTATSSEPTQLHLLSTVALSSACVSSSTALFARISQGKDGCDLNDQVLGRDDFSPFSSFDEDQKHESSDYSQSSTMLMACLMSPLLMKLWTLPWKDLLNNKFRLQCLKRRSKSILGNWKHNSISTRQWQSSKRKILMI
jgi:hypothetical protein